MPTPAHLPDTWADWQRASGARPKSILTRLAALSSLRTHCGHDPSTVATIELVAWLGQCRSPWTRVTYWRAVRGWCAWLVLMGVRDDDPVAVIPRPPEPHSVPRPAPAAAVAKALAEPASHRSYAYVALAAYAGLRVHEIAQMRGEDVDADAGALYVSGKGGTRAMVPLHPALARLAWGMPERGWWFRGRGGSHVQPISVTITVGRAMTRAGAPGVTAHQIRHLFGTTLLRSGANMRVVQTAMRHRSVTSTQVYTAVSDDELHAAVGRLSWVALSA